MAAEPDHLLWKCLCCEYWVEIFMPRFSLSVSHFHTCMYTSLWLTWSAQGWEALCSFFPLLSTPSPPIFHIHAPPPPITLPRLYSQNNTAGQGRASLQVQTYHVKRWHIFWRNWAKMRRDSFGRENMNKGVLIRWSPVAYKDKWRTAKEKLLTIQTLWMTAWRPKERNITLDFRVWMQSNGLCVCSLVVSLLELRSKWISFFTFSSFCMMFLIWTPCLDM